MRVTQLTYLKGTEFVLQAAARCRKRRATDAIVAIKDYIRKVTRMRFPIVVKVAPGHWLGRRLSASSVIDRGLPQGAESVGYAKQDRPTIRANDEGLSVLAGQDFCCRG